MYHPFLLMHLRLNESMTDGRSVVGTMVKPVNLSTETGLEVER